MKRRASIIYYIQEKELLTQGLKQAEDLAKSMSISLVIAVREDYDDTRLSEYLKKNNKNTDFKIFTLSEKISSNNLKIAEHNALFFMLFKKPNMNTYNLIINLKIPSLIINEKSAQYSFNNILINLTDNKESKQQIIWTSYFGRFNKSKIIINCSKSESLSQKNIHFTEKLYEGFKFEYEINRFEVNADQNRRYYNDVRVISERKKPRYIERHISRIKLNRMIKKTNYHIFYILPQEGDCIPCS